MGLDINTPKGQATLKQEREAIRLLRKHCPDLRYTHTPKETESVIDGIIVDAKSCNQLYLVEMKCRNMTFQQFSCEYDSNWLVTYDKIEAARRLSESLVLPFHGYLYLLPERKLLVKELYVPKRGWQASFAVRKTVTQATCNGGKANRDNAYIDMTGARVFE